MFVFLLILSVTSFPVTNGNVRCRPKCNVEESLGCEVKYQGVDCLFTGLSSGPVWPAKPRRLAITQFKDDLTSKDEVGMNITWRFPNDASALSMKGFEVSLYLTGQYATGIRNCYHMSFNVSKAVDLQVLVSTVFSMECYVSTLAEGIGAEVTSLPKSKGKKNRSHKFMKLKAPVRVTKSICGDDPHVVPILLVDVFPPQLVVNINPGHKRGVYNVALMFGAFEVKQQIIDLENGTLSKSTVFEDPRDLKVGYCYGVWVWLSTCKTPWSNNKEYCIPEITSTLRPTVLSTKPKEDTGEIVGTPQTPELSRTALIIVVILSIGGIIILGIAIICLVLHRRQNPPDPVPAREYRPLRPESREIRYLVVLYEVSYQDLVRKFITYLKKIKPQLQIFDYLEEDEVFRNEVHWLSELTGRAISDEGRLLIINSSGLVRLAEAVKKHQSYVRYEEKNFRGELLPKFWPKLRNMLFYCQRYVEIVISFGEEFEEGFYKSVLVNYSGLKLNLFQKQAEGGVSVDQDNMKILFGQLCVSNNRTEDALNDPILAEISLDVSRMLAKDKDWFVQEYGPPVAWRNLCDTNSISSVSTGFSWRSEVLEEDGCENIVNGSERTSIGDLSVYIYPPESLSQNPYPRTY